MRYLSFYRDSHPIACIDLEHPRRETVRTVIHLVAKYRLEGFVSNHKNIFEANFERTGDHPDPLKSRIIKSTDLVERLRTEEALDILEPLLLRGKDKKPRKMHPHSLQNLRPAPRFDSASRPARCRKISDDQLRKAIELRLEGASWREVGRAVGHNFQGVRSAIHRRGKILMNSDQFFTQRTIARPGFEYLNSH